MNADTIYNLAQSAATRARRRLDHEYPTHDDYDDAVQEAACAIVGALVNYPGRGNGYYVEAGTDAIVRFLTRSWWRQPHTQPISDAIAAAAHDTAADDETTTTRVIDRLSTAGRHNGGARAARAIAHDRAILDMRDRGYTEREIARALNTTQGAVHQALTRLKRRAS